MRNTLVLVGALVAAWSQAAHAQEDCLDTLSPQSGIVAILDCLKNSYETDRDRISALERRNKELSTENAALRSELENLSVVPTTFEPIPPGAVVAFLSSETEPCPGEEWSIYDNAKGRFIVGAGHDRQNGLTFKSIGETGGAETHTLTIGEIPAHDHGAGHALTGTSLPWGGGNHPIPTTANAGNQHVLNFERGENQPHNNMPPFIALYFCKKG